MQIGKQGAIIGLFESKSSIIGAALDVSGAFDKSRKTDRAVAFGVALGVLDAGKEVRQERYGR